MTNKKIASEIAIGVVLLLAFAVGGIFWLQNKNSQAPAVRTPAAVQPVAAAQPAPPAQPDLQAGASDPAITITDWRTYTEDKYGFSIICPASWKADELTLDNAFYQGIVFNESDVTPSHAFAQLGIFYYESIGDVSYSDKSSEPKTLEQYMKDPMFSSAKAIVFEGSNAFAATVKDSSGAYGGDKSVIFIEKSAHIYEINYNPNDKDADAIKSVIATFKFTK